MSGGLSPDLDSLDPLATLDRVKEVPISGLLTDLLWSEPVEVEESIEVKSFKSNTSKGAGFVYGP